METTARGDTPKALHNIAFVSIPESADLEFLLWDLQDAIAAYARLSGTVLPCPVDLKANNADAAADGSVLAVENMPDDESMSVAQRAPMSSFKPPVGAPRRRTCLSSACAKLANFAS